jgi:hypothetical protein
MNDTKKINGKKLFEVISYNNEEQNKKTRDKFFNENKDYYPSPETNKYLGWDHSAYIKRLEAFIKNEELSKYIFIEKIDKPILIKEDNNKYLVKNKIIIKNLTVVIEPFDTIKLFGSGFPEEYCIEGSRLSDNSYKCGLFVSFEKIQFVDESKGINSYLTFVFGPNSRVDLKECVFDDIDVFFSASNENNYLFATRCKFPNRHIRISLGSTNERRVGHGSNYYSIPSEPLSKAVAAQRLTEKIQHHSVDGQYNDYSSHRVAHYLRTADIDSSFDAYLNSKISDINDITTKDLLLYFINRDESIHVNPEDVFYTSQYKAVAVFQDCEITEIKFDGSKIFFEGKNIIEKLTTESDLEKVYYGAYNRLDKDGKYARTHKTIFSRWKEEALKSKDRVQEIICDKEIMNIERHILKYEKGDNSFFKDVTKLDRFILWFNSVSSDYGTNWLKPIFGIVFFNAFFVTILLMGLDYRFNPTIPNIFNTIGIFSEFLIPTKSVESVLDIEALNKGWELFNFGKNILVSVLIYQAIRAFRKYSIK